MLGYGTALTKRSAHVIFRGLLSLLICRQVRLVSLVNSKETIPVVPPLSNGGKSKRDVSSVARLSMAPREEVVLAILKTFAIRLGQREKRKGIGRTLQNMQNKQNKKSLTVLSVSLPIGLQQTEQET